MTLYASRRAAFKPAIAAARAAQKPYRDESTAPYRLFAWALIRAVAGVLGSGLRSFLFMELELFIWDGEPSLDEIEGNLLVGYEDPSGTKPNQFLL